MVIMHLAAMNHCEQELDPHDVIHQVSGDSVSAGEQSLAAGVTRGSGRCMRDKPVKVIPCPRCQSMNTKFCYYNNYSVNQPRHFCRNCQRYWTVGGTLRNVPVGGGSRKKVRTRQRSNDGPQQPRESSRGFSGAELNMNQTQQFNVNHQLLPSTLQMVTTQQQLSLLSQVTVGKLGSYGNQPLLQSTGVIELQPPNTTTPSHLPMFFHFSNLSERDQQQNGFNATGSLSKNPSTEAAASTGLLMNQRQDHMSTLHSASCMYELQSTTTVPNSRLQLATGANSQQAAAPGLFSNVAGGLYYTPQKLDGNQIQFLNSVLQKPGYWGA